MNLKQEIWVLEKQQQHKQGQGEVADRKKVEVSENLSQEGSQGLAHWDVLARVKNQDLKCHGNSGERKAC